MIANSGHDERGKYSGGVAGDQTGTEWNITKWYSRPWNCVLRYPDKTVAKKIAELAKKSANNDFIGYNQADRTSFWYALEKADYDPSNIKTRCNADCSSGVSAIVKAVGYMLDIPLLKSIAITNYTGSMKPNFKVAGFEVLTDDKYLMSDKYLEVGDILLNISHHTAINLDDGANVKPTYKEGWIQDEITDRWWYQYKDGTYAKDGWVEIGNKWYCFDSDGWLLTNQYIKSSDYANNGKLYYVDKSGVWDGKIYKWEKDKKGWWICEYKNPKGYLKNTWAYVDGKWYYFMDSGYMVKGQGYPINGITYQFDDEGVLVEQGN